MVGRWMLIAMLVALGGGVSAVPTAAQATRKRSVYPPDKPPRPQGVSGATWNRIGPFLGWRLDSIGASMAGVTLLRTGLLVSIFKFPSTAGRFEDHDLANLHASNLANTYVGWTQYGERYFGQQFARNNPTDEMLRNAGRAFASCQLYGFFLTELGMFYGQVDTAIVKLMMDDVSDRPMQPTWGDVERAGRFAATRGIWAAGEIPRAGGPGCAHYVFHERITPAELLRGFAPRGEQGSPAGGGRRRR